MGVFARIGAAIGRFNRKLEPTAVAAHSDAGGPAAGVQPSTAAAGVEVVSEEVEDEAAEPRE
jgi:hypothetical protein